MCPVGAGSELVAGVGDLGGEGVEEGQLVGAEGDVQGGDVLLEPLDPLGAGDRREVDAEALLLGVHPGQRDLRGGDARGVGHLADRLHNGQVLLPGLAGEPRVATAEVPVVQCAQVALAWAYAQQERLGVPLAPIPGTKRVTWLDQNVAALDVTLTADELAILDPLATQVAGARY